MNVQMSYMVLALIIFTLLALSFNNKGNSDLDTRLYHEAVVTLTEMGDALINEISQLDFDEELFDVSTGKKVKVKIKDKIKLTPPGQLGKDGETKKKDFDDIDDYNGFEQLVILERLDSCILKVKINYIDIANPDVEVGYPTWYKKITVVVSNSKYLKKGDKEFGDYEETPVTLYYIKSY